MQNLFGLITSLIIFIAVYLIILFKFHWIESEDINLIKQSLIKKK